MDKCRIEFGADDKVTYYGITGGAGTPGRIDADELRLDTIARFQYWTANCEDHCQYEDLRVLGLHLYNMLFPLKSKIRDSFEQEYKYFVDQRGEGEKKAEQHRLRLTLVFTKAAEKWVSYPWEFLYMPWSGKGFFLAGEDTELILTRYVPDALPKWDADEQPLRILVAVAQPKGMPTIDAEDVIKYIEGLKSPGHIDVKTVRDPTYQQLQGIINNPQVTGGFPPHILHFIGHGAPGRLFLVKSKEQATADALEAGSLDLDWKDPTNATTVSNLFHKNTTPKLVFLHACSGAQSGSIDGFNDVARELVYSQVPAVVAMQYEITNEAATKFALEFYTRISEGSQIDEAVKEGRRKLGIPEAGAAGAWNDRSFGTPVIYLQHEDPIVKKGKPADSTGGGGTTPKPTGKVPCPNPKCNGLVIPGDKMCIECEHDIAVCPKCGSVMDVEKGRCARCKYQAAAVPQATAAPPLPPLAG